MRNAKRMMAALMTAAMVFTSAGVAPVSNLAVYAAGEATETATENAADNVARLDTKDGTAYYTDFMEAVNATNSSTNAEKEAKITLLKDVKATAPENPISVPLEIVFDGKKLTDASALKPASPSASGYCMSEYSDKIVFAKHETHPVYNWKYDSKADPVWQVVGISLVCDNCDEIEDVAVTAKTRRDSEGNFVFTQDSYSDKKEATAETSGYSLAEPAKIVDVNGVNQHQDGKPVVKAKLTKNVSGELVDATVEVTAATSDEIKSANVGNNTAATCQEYGAKVYKVIVKDPDGNVKQETYLRDAQAIAKLDHIKGEFRGYELLTKEATSYASEAKAKKAAKAAKVEVDHYSNEKNDDGKTVYYYWYWKDNGQAAVNDANAVNKEDGKITYRPYFACDYVISKKVSCSEKIKGDAAQLTPYSNATKKSEDNATHSNCETWKYPDLKVTYVYTMNNGDTSKSTSTFTATVSPQKKDESVVKHVSDGTKSEVVVNADCENEGTKRIHCLVCDKDVTIKSDKAGHTAGAYPTASGTPTAQQIAASAGVELESKQKVTLSSDRKSATVEASCTKDGGKFEWCTNTIKAKDGTTVKGHWHKTETTEATGHDLRNVIRLGSETINEGGLWANIEEGKTSSKDVDYTFTVKQQCNNNGCDGQIVQYHSLSEAEADISEDAEDYKHVFSAITIVDQEKGTDCKTDAKTTYTVNGLTRTDGSAVKKEVKNGNGVGDHKYTATSWDWSKDFEAATATLKCSVKDCDHQSDVKRAKVTQTTEANGITTFVATYGDATDTKKAYTLKDAKVTFDASAITDGNLVEGVPGAHQQVPEVTVTKNGTVIDNSILDFEWSYNNRKASVRVTFKDEVQSSKDAEYVEGTYAESDEVYVAAKKRITGVTTTVLRNGSEYNYHDKDGTYSLTYNPEYSYSVETKAITPKSGVTVKYAITDKEIQVTEAEKDADTDAKQAKIEALEYNLDKVENITDAGKYYVYAQLTADGYTTYTTGPAVLIIKNKTIKIRVDDATVTEGETPNLSIRAFTTNDLGKTEEVSIDSSEFQITTQGGQALDSLKPGVYKLNVTVPKNYEAADEVEIDYIGTLTVVAKETAKPGNQTSGHPKQGFIYTVNGKNYKVTNKAGQIVKFKTASNKKSVAIPATVTLMDGKKYKVTVIGGNAFKYDKIKSVTVGANVRKINPKAFADSNVTTITLKTKKLSKAAVKNALKDSKVKTIKVSVGSAKENKTYVAKYKKIFTKANAGKKVTVK